MCNSTKFPMHELYTIHFFFFFGHVVGFILQFHCRDRIVAFSPIAPFWFWPMFDSAKAFTDGHLLSSTY